MSKDIDTSDLDDLSQAELRYLRDRAVLTPEQEAEYIDDSEDEDEGYEAQTLADLKAEVEARNGGREEDDKIVPEGRTKSAYVKALTADDED
jgi:hypothetical protein